MASPFDNRAVTPIITSLSRSCLIKVAISLWPDLGKGILDMAFDRIQRRVTIPWGWYPGPTTIKLMRAYKSLLLIPPLLRNELISAVHSLENEVGNWKDEHEGMVKLKDKDHVFYWRSDGTIDRIKTAQRLVLETDIDIVTRFDVACNYCLVENVHTLWAELQISGKTEGLKIFSHYMVSFWVRRIREGSHDPWPQAALEYLDYLRLRSCLHVYTKLACSRSIFPLLQEKDRERFLVCFQFANPDDIRFCLYTMTKEEQEQVLSTCAWKVLCLYFEPPLRNFFLETAKKIWNYIDETSFYILLNVLLCKSNMHNYMQDCDYSIIEDLWNMSPNNFRERARNDSSTRGRIDSFLNEMRKKRKAEDEMNEQMRKRVR